MFQKTDQSEALFIELSRTCEKVTECKVSVNHDIR